VLFLLLLHLGYRFFGGLLLLCYVVYQINAFLHAEIEHVGVAGVKLIAYEPALLDDVFVALRAVRLAFFR
jgi:hypothetical protein